MFCSVRDPLQAPSSGVVAGVASERCGSLAMLLPFCATAVKRSSHGTVALIDVQDGWLLITPQRPQRLSAAGPQLPARAICES